MENKKILSLVIFSLFSCFMIFSKDYKVKIIDKDIGIPLEGVKIKVSGIESTFYSDKNGICLIKLDESSQKAVIICSLTGYQVKKVLINDFSKETTIEMFVEGYIEGKELVIEESYYNKKDKVGTSFLVDKEDIKNLSMRGTMEDAVQSVKALPGVSYNASFQTDLSIRGGKTDELVASLDGFIVRDIFYWGGSYSIFNPNLINSVVFNNGVFSVKNGFATSGLMEVNTLYPDRGLRFDFKLATSTFESRLEIPITKKSGILLSGRVTYLDLTIGPIWRAQGQDVKRAPYIYDAMLKWFFKPTEKFEWFIEGFYGADGIAMTYMNDEQTGIKINGIFDNENYHAIGFTGFKAVPNEKLLINYIVGYEFLYRKNSYSGYEKGEKDYSNTFKKEYNITDDSFKVNIESEGDYHRRIHSLQSKFDLDLELHKQVYFSAGTGLIYDFTNQVYYNKYFDNLNSQIIKDNNDLGNLNKLFPYAFINFSFYPIPEALEIQLGCRVDHFTGFANGRTLFSYPTANPRFYIAYTPFKNLKYLDYLTISLGVGLYSKIPDFRYDINDPLKDYQIKQIKVLSNVLGLEMMFPYGFKIKLEGYYKYYFDRYYSNTTIKDGEYEHKQHCDGYGHVAGFDFILKRKISRYIDGWISYSFIYTRFYNPKSDGMDFSDDGDPNKSWYYPTYHRWHSFNLVLNIKPTNWLTFSPSIGVHSGIPKKVYGDKETEALYAGGDVMQIYTRKLKYSDSLRTYPSVPFNFKMDFHFFIPKTKVQMEIYAAIDNIFSLFYNPDREETVNKYNGKIIDQSPAAYETFTPSGGIRISF